MTNSAPAPAPAPVAPSDSEAQVRVNDRSTSVRVSASDLAPQRSGVLASAIDQTGTPVQDLTPDSLITVQGIQMRLSAAEREGMVVRDPETGDYREPTEEERKESQSENKAQTEQVRLPDEHAESNLDQIVLGMQAYGADPMTLITDLIADPTQPPKAFAELSRRYDINPSDLNQAWVHIVQAGHDQAHSLVREMGLDSEAVFAWAENTRNHELASAMMRHFSGDLSGYRRLAEAYSEANGLPAGPVQNTDGVTVLSNDGGVVTVRMPGGSHAQFSVGIARRRGWIS